MKKLLFILLFLSIPCLALAQTLGFLQIPQETDVLSRGNTGVSYSGTPSIPSNLADAALMPATMAISANYMLWQPRVNTYHLIGASGTYKINSRTAIGVSFKDFVSPSYEITDPTGRPSGSFTPAEFTIGTGVSYRIIDCLSAGIAVGYYSSSLGENVKATGWDANLSIKYKDQYFQAGLALDHLGAAVNYGKEKQSMPTMARAGVAISIARLTASLEADYILSNGLAGGAGLEYTVMNLLYFRAGYHYGNADGVLPSYASVGLGVKYAGFCMDLAWLTASSVLGNSLSCGIGYSF